ncbi:acetyltransferase [Vibrio cholerae]|nr:acetyltransferase [Vibrio cholerae]
MQLLCLSLVVMRCQPLRRALCLRSKIWKITSES